MLVILGLFGLFALLVIILTGRAKEQSKNLAELTLITLPNGKEFSFDVYYGDSTIVTQSKMYEEYRADLNAYFLHCFSSDVRYNTLEEFRVQEGDGADIDKVTEMIKNMI